MRRDPDITPLSRGIYVPRTWYCVTRDGSFFTLWPDIGRAGRVTSDPVRCLGVTQSVRVGYIAALVNCCWEFDNVKGFKTLNII